MTLAARRAVIPLDGSLSQHVAAEVVRPPYVRGLVNARWNKVGQICKRFGSDAVPHQRVDDGLAFTSSRKLFPRENQLLHIDGHFVDSRVDPTAQGWKKLDRVPEALLDRFPVHGEYSAGPLNSASVAQGNGYLCLVYEDTLFDSITAVVVDEERDSVVSVTVLTASGGGARPHVIFLNNTFIAIWVATAATQLRAATFATSTLTWSGVTNIVTNVGANSVQWDVAPDDAGNFFFLTYVQSPGGELNLRRYDSTLTLTHTAANQRAGKTIVGVAVFEEGTRVYLALQNSTDNTVECIGYATADLSAGFAVTVVQALAGAPFGTITVGSRTSTDAWIAWEIAFSAATPPTTQAAVQWKTISNAGVVTATLHETRNCQIGSRVFRYDAHSYMVVGTGGPGFFGEQYGLCMVDLGNDYIASANYRARPVARWADGELFDQFGLNHISAVPTNGDGTFWCAYAMKDFEEAGTSRGASIEYARIKLNDGQRWQCIEAHRGVMMPAGFPHAFDGERCFEAGFSFYPWVQQSGLIGGGILPLNEEQEYILCYVYTDALGRIWRSTPSVSVVHEPTVAGTQTVRLAVPHYTISSMYDVDVLDVLGSFKNPVGIEVYRRNNTTSANGPFVRILTTVGGFTGSVQPCNPLGSDFMLILDTGLTDADQPELYTSGNPGAQEHEVPPPFSYVVGFDGRVIGADRRTVWPSQEMVQREGIFWNSANSFRVDEDGDITGFSVQDFSCIVWKRAGIYYFQGTGPDDTGLNGAYTAPSRVSTDDGCIDARSLVLTPVGTFYQSERGIMLLDRQFNTDYIGAPVEDTLAEYPEILAATVFTEESEVRFWCRHAVSNDFRMIVYDYHRKKWCVRAYFSEENVFDGAITALVHRGEYFWATEDGFIAQETDEFFGDFDGATTTYAHLDLSTADISLDGFAGFQRIWYLTLTGKALYENAVDGPVVLVDVFTDYADEGATPIATYTFQPINSIQPSFPIVQYRMGPLPSAAQNCQAIRLRIRDGEIPGDTFNEGIAWTSLMLEYGVETGRGRFPANQRA